MKKLILVAGASGNLGLRIVKALTNNGVEIRAVLRSGTNPEKIKEIEQSGARIFIVDKWNKETLTEACNGASCVVSALAGLREVIIAAQRELLDAAIAAGVPRFIPSDYSLDFTKFSHGENRNLDLRREFHQYLDKSAIAPTSIFNGAFTDMITNEMPLIFFKQKLILYWGHADYKWGLTTMDNTATYTANVALDDASPRYLRIAGDQISPRMIRAITSEVMGIPFRLIRAGNQWMLGLLIKIARKFSLSDNNLYPAWQGMQYMHNMIDKRSKIDVLNNNRYAAMKWTTVKDVLTEYKATVK